MAARCHVVEITLFRGGINKLKQKGFWNKINWNIKLVKTKHVNQGKTKKPFGVTQGTWVLYPIRSKLCERLVKPRVFWHSAKMHSAWVEPRISFFTTRQTIKTFQNNFMSSCMLLSFVCSDILKRPNIHSRCNLGSIHLSRVRLGMTGGIYGFDKTPLALPSEISSGSNAPLATGV